MIGLQGAGKTTATGKLANYLKARGRSPMLVAADVTTSGGRAVEDTGQRLDVPVFHQADTAPQIFVRPRRAKPGKTAVMSSSSIPLDDWLSMNPSWLN